VLEVPGFPLPPTRAAELTTISSPPNRSAAVATNASTEGASPTSATTGKVSAAVGDLGRGGSSGSASARRSPPEPFGGELGGDRPAMPRLPVTSARPQALIHRLSTSASLAVATGAAGFLGRRNL
jgi:hypothetical protein